MGAGIEFRTGEVPNIAVGTPGPRYGELVRRASPWGAGIEVRTGEVPNVAVETPGIMLDDP